LSGYVAVMAYFALYRRTGAEKWLGGGVSLLACEQALADPSLLIDPA
jgi:hypothetical protein